MNLFRPRRTPEAVARELAAGLRDGSVVLGPPPPDTPDNGVDLQAVLGDLGPAAGPDVTGAVAQAIRESLAPAARERWLELGLALIPDEASRTLPGRVRSLIDAARPDPPPATG